MPLPELPMPSWALRNAFLKGSLAASNRGFKQISSWFGSSEPRKRPCSMRFHDTWQDPECNVMKWYQLQTQSSTQLTSVQHWRELEGPFFHEYLMLQLVDGSMCQLERLGDGSHPNAVLPAGCMAHDMIRWFTVEDSATNSSQLPAELITEIHFPVLDGPDLLDVLAICYSIQRIRPTSAYTLQKFNCYFFCITILAVLSRYICLRQNPVTNETHSRVVNFIMNKLRKMGHGDTSEYLALGFCSLLAPEQRNPQHFIYDALQGNLEAWSHNILSNPLAGTVWESNRVSAMKKSLPKYIGYAIDVVLASENASVNILQSLRRGDSKGHSNNVWELATQSNTTKALRRSLYESAREASRVAYDGYYQGLTHSVSKPSRSRKLLTTILGAALPPSLSSTFSLLSTTGPAASAWAEVYKNSQDDALSLFGLSLGDLSFTRRIAFMLVSATMKDKDKEPNNINYSQDSPQDSTTNLKDARVNALLDYRAQARSKILQSPLWDTREKQLSVLGCLFEREIWEHCLIQCVSRATDGLDSLLPSGSIRVCTTEWGVECTIAHFQSYLRERIIKHATRVEAAGLGIASSIQADIEEAIDMVGMSLPNNFGSSRGAERT